MMADAAPQLGAATDFLAWEAQQPERWEKINGVVRMMVGGTLRHNKLCRALANALARRASTGCAVSSENFKLQIGADVVYPDVMLMCPSPPDAAIVTPSALIVAEVESPSNSAAYQRRKLALYQSLAPLQMVIQLSQDEIAALVYRRQGDLWLAGFYAGADAAVALPGCAEPLLLGELYAQIEFSAGGAA